MKMFSHLFLGLLLCTSLRSACAVDVSAWSKRMSITFPGYTNAETLTSFPMEVRFNTAGISGFNYTSFSSTNGYDLRFTDGSTNAFLNYEFEKWNTGGSSYVWVKMPNVVAGTNILAFWGNPAATTQQAYTTNGSAWSSTFVGVWHLNESAGPFKDSTANGNNSIGDANSIQITGISGLKNGRHFDGGQNIPNPTNGYINFANTPSMQSLWSGSTGGTNSSDYTSTGGLFMTVEFWSRIPSTPEEYQRIISCFSTDGWGMQTLGGRFRFDQNGMGTTGTVYIMDNAWHYCSHTYDGNTSRGKIYTDGNLDADYVTSYVHGYPYGFAIGAGGPGNIYQPNATGHGNPFNGEVDEVRITRGVRSPTWVKTSFMTVQSNTTFQSYGAVQDLVPGESQVLINNGESWKYFSTGSIPTSTWYSAAYSDATWSNGLAPLGYNDPAIATVVPYGSDISNKWITTYFRKHFTVSNAVAVTGLVAQFEVDDGAVFYLNGTRIHTTTNMIEPVSNASMTSGTALEPYDWINFTINPNLLVTGDNVLAVEVHQAAPDSSDLYMDMTLTKTGTPTTNELGGGISAPTSPSDWTAYNDTAWTDANTFGTNADPVVSGYTTNSPWGKLSGTLITTNGQSLTALVTFTTNGTTGFDFLNREIVIPVGSPAAQTFAGHVGSNNAAHWTGGTVSMTLSGLNTGKEYSVVLWSSRGATGATYSNRWTDIVISSVDSFVNNSTAGNTIFTTGTANDSIRVVSVIDQGRVAKYDSVHCGSDGTIVFSLTANGLASGDTNGYLNAFMVQESPVSAGNTNTIPDNWKITYFGSTNAANGGTFEDYDHDGFSNYGEWRAGTDPTNAGSAFVVSGMTNTTGSQVVMTWSSVNGKTYSILQTTNLVAAWSTVQSGIAGTAPLNVYTVAVANAHTFLRIKLE